MIEIIKFPFTNTPLIQQSFKIRKEVFVIEQNCPPEIEYEFEEVSTHFLLKFDGKPICTSRHRTTKDGVKLERFAVLKKYRKKGIGHKILQFMLEDLKEFKGLIYMHAQIDVIPFYEKMGFVKRGGRFEEAFIMHYKMVLNQ